MVIPGSTKATREIEMEKFIIHRSWKKYAVYFKESHWEFKAGHKQRER